MQADIVDIDVEEIAKDGQDEGGAMMHDQQAHPLADDTRPTHPIQLLEPHPSANPSPPLPRLTLGVFNSADPIIRPPSAVHLQNDFLSGTPDQPISTHL